MYLTKSTNTCATLTSALLVFTLSAISFNSLASIQVKPKHSVFSQSKILQSSDNKTSTEAVEDIETIVIQGDDQIVVLRHNYIRAENDFFTSFNELTSDEDFKITCKKKKRHSFTRIVKRKCESAFESKIFKQVMRETQRFDPNVAYLPPPGLVLARQKRIREKQISEMEDMVRSSPELQKKLLALIDAKRKYNKARGAREDWGVNENE